MSQDIWGSLILVGMGVNLFIIFLMKTNLSKIFFSVIFFWGGERGLTIFVYFTIKKQKFDNFRSFIKHESMD